MALIGGRRVAVELKYLLRDPSATAEDELFELPFQSVQDVRRYDFVKDVARLELLRAEGVADDGFAIALTNDPNYWQGGDREGVGQVNALRSFYHYLERGRAGYRTGAAPEKHGVRSASPGLRPHSSVDRAAVS